MVIAWPTFAQETKAEKTEAKKLQEEIDHGEVVETTESKLAERLNTATPQERAGFALYKLNEAIPNFDNWVRGTERFKRTVFRQRSTLVKQETARLKNLFQNYDIKNDPIILDLPIRLRVSPSQDNNFSLAFKFAKNIKGDHSYVAQTFSNEDLAIIFHKPEILNTIAFTAEEFHENVRKYWYEDTNYSATLSLELIPLTADIEDKMDIEKTPHWTLFAEIKNAEITYYDRFIRENITLWAHNTENNIENE